jgi:hypothetical protein
MPVAGGPFIQKTGILLEVDSADKTSYSGTGTTWINQVRPGTNNGTLNNISFDSTDSKGALVFTGSNTFVDFGNLGPSLTSSFSFQVAFEPAATASGQGYTILSYASASSTSSITFKLDYTSSNQTVVLTTFSNTGSQNIVYAMSASVASGSWNIVHGTFGSQLAALYVNGLNATTAVTTGSTVGYNASNRLYVGLNFGSTSGYYSGSIANIIVNNADLNLTSVNRNYNALASRFGLRVVQSGVTDIDALNFINATGIENFTQTSAINTLVVGLKANNLWNKMRVIYPFVGGTATTHKYNLKDPTLYPINWLGAILHGPTGVTFLNGGYGDVPTFNTNILSQNNTSFSYYNKTTLTTADTRFFIGNTGLQAGFTFGAGYAEIFGGNINTLGNSIGVIGYSIFSRTNSADFSYYRDSSLITTVTRTSGAPNSSTFTIGSLSGAQNSTTQLSTFTTVGDGLSASEVTTLNTLVQAYQTTLGR